MSFVGIAERMLVENGGFLPYGAAMKHDGELISISAYDGEEHPPAQELIDLLNYGFKAGADTREYRATALFFDARVNLPDSGHKSEAIAIAVDHIDSYSVVVFHPYSLSNGDLVFGDVFAQEGDYQIFRTTH